MAMRPSSEDYERVARWLDGEPVRLTAEQQTLAREVAGDLDAVGAALDCPPRPGILHRVAAAAARAANADCELAARRLDGERVALTAEQEALAAEVAADLDAVAPALDVAMPAGTLHRVAARLQPAKGHTFVVKWHIGRAAAAAAVVAIALGMLWVGSGPPARPAPAGELAADVYLRELVRNPDPGLGAEIKAVETDLAGTHAAVVLGEPSDLEVAVAYLADEIRTALDEDEAAKDADAWQQWIQNL